MWKKLSNATKQEIATLRGSKKIKLYADEDIEEEVVEFFRDNGVNIIGARELGLKGKPDSFHVALAFKKKRFLLTKNAKHYQDDKEVPFDRVHGMIAIAGDMSDTQSYVRSLLWVFDLIPYGEIYTGMKIHCSPSEASFRFVDSDGCLTVKRFKTERGHLYEWVSKEEGAEN